MICKVAPIQIPAYVPSDNFELFMEEILQEREKDNYINNLSIQYKDGYLDAYIKSVNKMMELKRN